VNPRLRFVLITLATLVAVGVTGSLGFWQLSRAAQKQSRQMALDMQSAKSPVNAATVRATADALTLLHQRVRVQGTWVPQSTVFLENRPMNGRVGFIVVTALVLEGGGPALAVQRGWAPRGFEDRALVPQTATPLGVVEIEGRMALPPSDLYALGAPTAGVIRQNLDLTQFRVQTGLPLISVTLQQTGVNADGLVRDWPVANLGVEKNYGYAAQWFGLALLFTLLYLWFQVLRRFIDHPKDTTSDV